MRREHNVDAEKSKVAKYITRLIDQSDKTQKQIADEIGYKNPNNMAHIKKGGNRMPINRIAAFSAAVGSDPAHLLRMCLAEYMPDTWEAIEKILGKNATLSDKEIQLIEYIRAQTDNEIAIDTDAEKDAIDHYIKELNR